MPSTVISRRAALRGLCSSVACTVLVAPVSWVGASSLLDDRVDLLYSNRFAFDAKGRPLLTVGLLQGRQRVRITAPGGLRVRFAGEGGPSIEAGQRFEVCVGQASAARQAWSVVLEEHRGIDPRAVEGAESRWRAQGYKVEDREVGTVFGIAGEVLDNRRLLVTTGRFASETAAREEAERARRHGALASLHPLVERRGEGSIIGRDLDQGSTIRSPGVLWFETTGDKAISVQDLPSDGPQPQARSYRGRIYVAIGRDGRLVIGNLIGEVDVLAGLLPAEMFASAPEEALKAQAIAARGQLVSKVGTRHLDDPFLLCADQHCQVYAGHGHEQPRTTKAVHDTVGRVLMRPDAGLLVDTVYSANSGGHTEDNERVWPGLPDPQLRGRPDPLLTGAYRSGIDESNIRDYIAAPPRVHSHLQSSPAAFRWQATIDPGLVPEVGRIEALEVLSRGRSGRADRLRIIGKKKQLEVAGELAIRKLLGGLKSSMFVVQRERDAYGRFVLVGGGHGHGVGMCQHGAIGMAQAGRDVKAILSHYYGGARLVKLW